MKKVVFLVILICPLAGFAQHSVSGVRVTIAPPALRLEVAPPAPSLRHQWIAGYWAWRASRQVWIEGHWILPPGPGYVWQPASWENRGGIWFFYEGYWRAADAPDPGVVYQPPPPPGRPEIVETAPPQPIEEVRPAAPFPDALWIPGYWDWSGVRYVWVAGRWSARPQGYAWEDYRWKHRRDGKWEHKHGHWHPHDDDD
jgi:hypothetical protein